MAGGSAKAAHAPVLESKLQVPRVRGSAVRRDQLLAAIASNEDRGSHITVVSAPAGAGKTMLLAQRTEQLRSAGAPVAWLSLDSDDNKARTLWSGLLAASRLAASGSDSAGRALKALRPPVKTIDDGFLGAFFDAVDRMPQGLWLVLDDVQEIVDGATVADLARLLTSAPPQLRVMLGCRYDPPLPIPRMIMEERAAEIRGADLAFDRHEARRLLLGYSIELADSDLDLLLAKTEGWAAGLRLAALSMAQSQDVSAYLEALAGDNSAVAAYLVSEVLAHQPADVVRFLLATSTAEWLTADLAAELSRRDDAGAILDRLSHDNALVIQRDSSPRTYRYHALLRSYLLAELDRRDAGARRELHRVAADWFARNGEILPALDHATRAGDDARVTAIVSSHGLRLSTEGNGVALAKALDAASDEVLAEPTAALVAAMSALLDGDTWRATQHIGRVGRDVTIHRRPWLRTLHATALLYEGRLRGVSSPDTAALISVTRAYTAGDPDLQLLASLARGAALLGLGDPAAADTDLSDALVLARQGGRDYVALDCLGYSTLSAAAMSDFAGMAARAAEAIEFATQRGWASTGPMLRIYLAAGWAAWQATDVDAAERHVLSATAVEADAEAGVHMGLELLSAYVQFSKSNDRIRLRDRLREIWLGANAAVLTAKEISTFSLLELRTALSRAHDSWADDVLARTQDLLGDAPDVDVLRTMLHAHHGRNTAAYRTLRPIIIGDRTCTGINAQITAWLLEAHLAAADDDEDRAEYAVAHAIDLAAPRGALRIVITTTSGRVRDLLHARQGRFGPHEGFVAQALTAMNGTGPEHGALLSGAALTVRELELLRDLPSLLTLDEIAAAHVVSVNTVKTHLKALYRKLDVGGRRAAVERASELGLI